MFFLGSYTLKLFGLRLISCVGVFVSLLKLSLELIKKKNQIINNKFLSVIVDGHTKHSTAQAAQLDQSVVGLNLTLGCGVLGQKLKYVRSSYI